MAAQEKSLPTFACTTRLAPELDAKLMVWSKGRDLSRNKVMMKALCWFFEWYDAYSQHSEWEPRAIVSPERGARYVAKVTQEYKERVDSICEEAGFDKMTVLSNVLEMFAAQQGIRVTPMTTGSLVLEVEESEEGDSPFRLMVHPRVREEISRCLEAGEFPSQRALMHEALDVYLTWRAQQTETPIYWARPIKDDTENHMVVNITKVVFRKVQAVAAHDDVSVSTLTLSALIHFFDYNSRPT